MGVRGLQTFLKNNAQISERQQGSESQYCDIYGGDLVAYGQEVRKFFKALDLCNITPILVYDGSVIGKQSTSDQILLKEEETHRRGLDKFKSAKYITEQSPDKNSMFIPQLLSSTFKGIIGELGFQIIQAPYEADTQLARLANELNCPILTNDSDFIIYSLPVGFIILDMFYYKRPIKHKNLNRTSIECFLYSQNRLIKHVPRLQRETMPLLSILLGNDYIAAGTFDRVIDYLTTDQFTHGSGLEAITRSHRKIAALLNWLRGKSLSQAIDHVLRDIQPNARDNVRRSIEILLRSYNIERTDNFQSELEEIYPPRNDGPPELMPAAFLARAYEKSLMPSSALDIIFHNTFFSYPMIDDFTLPSAGISVKYRPFSLATALLRPRTYEGMSPERREIEIQRDSYRIFDRLNGEYIEGFIRPMEYLENFGSLKHMDLYSTIVLEPNLKKTMLFSTFWFNAEELNLMTDTLSLVFVEPFVHEARIVLLLIKYIGIETKVSPKPQFVDAIMLTLFFYAAIEGKLSATITQNANDYGQLLLKLKPHSMTNNGFRYEQSETLFRKINHFISQLHYAYTGFNMINKLLDYVLPNPKVENFFNGPLIFRMTKLLRLGDIKMKILCSRMQTFLDACDSIKVIVQCAE